MDIDCFKQYNDTYGHQMGDTVLKEVSKSIKNDLHRADDYCFRLGGEEFGVIFKSDSIEQSENFSDMIRQNIEKLALEHKNNVASDVVTVSMGLINLEPTQYVNKDAIYKQADDLLYESKQNGRNRLSAAKAK